MTVTFRDARDFTIWFDAWIEGKKKLSDKDVARLKEMVHAIPLDSAPVLPPKVAKPEVMPTPAPPKPAMRFPFIVDKDGYVRQGMTNRRVMPSDVTDMIGDLRGMDADISAIIWADDSTGINGADLNIVAA